MSDPKVFIGLLAAVFVIISSPKLYEITSRIAPSSIVLTRPGMQPTALGLLLHAAVFTALVIGAAHALERNM